MKKLFLLLLLVGLVLSLSAMELVPYGFDFDVNAINQGYDEATGCTVEDGVTFTYSGDDVSIDGFIVKCQEGPSVIHSKIDEYSGALSLAGINKEVRNVNGYEVTEFRANNPDVPSIYIMSVGDYSVVVACTSDSVEKSISTCDSVVESITENAGSSGISYGSSDDYDYSTDVDFSKVPSVCCFPTAIIGLALLSKR